MLEVKSSITDGVDNEAKRFLTAEKQNLKHARKIWPINSRNLTWKYKRSAIKWKACIHFNSYM